MPLLKSTETEIVYGTPAGTRLAAGLVGAFMLAVSTGIPILLSTSRAQYIGQSPLALADPIGFSCFSVMMGLFIFLSFQVNEEMVLDLQHRTYRYRAGITSLAHWHTGTFSDIDDVVLRKVSTKQGVRYRVALQWKQTGRGFWRAILRDMREFVLDQSDAKPLAETEKERKMLAERLALPGTTNHAETPEQVRQRSLRMTVLGAGVGVFLIALLFGPQALLAAQLNAQGRNVRATITGSRQVKNGYRVEFAYPVNGQTLRGEDTVAASSQSRMVGNTVVVTYLPDYPNTCRTSDSNDSLARSVLVLGMLGVPLMLVSLFYLYRFRPQSGGMYNSARL